MAVALRLDGVDLFFVLSGFLIGTQVLTPLSRGKPLDFTDFYLRRAFRILPAFLVVLAIYMAWPGFRESPGLAPWWMFLTFTLNLFVDYSEQAAFSHAWSLCVEEHFYLVFPLLAALLLRRPSAARVVAVCVAVVVAGIALRTSVWLHNTALDQLGGGQQRNWFVEDLYYPTWNRLDGLLAGVVLAMVKVFRPAHGNGCSSAATPGRWPGWPRWHWRCGCSASEPACWATQWAGRCFRWG